MTSRLTAERQGATLILTLDGPSTRNTLSAEIFDAGTEALNVAEADDSLRCVILQGAGGHFCGGGDLRRLAGNRQTAEGPDGQTGPQRQAAHLNRFHQFIEVLQAFPKPVIAAVEGAAAGGGFSLALACDLIVAAEDARFIMAYPKVGLSPDGGATWQLMQMLPRQLVLRMLWLGEAFSAQQLHQWGLVHQVSRSGAAVYDAIHLAERLAAMPAGALASIKELVNQWPQRTLTEQLGRERDQFVQNLVSADAGEGLQAFFDKRPARFRNSRG
ncbi:MAG: enoyl-CoA hydratase/isomerase family protein [Burkholderiales bacterium]|nr:enoyl-CoA hydratase/isomerase family protein [Burkholderiales bacterium]